MMPPKRRRASRHWICKQCDIELGTVATSIAAGRVLHPTAHLASAANSADDLRAWTLVCRAGHETGWIGDGISWREEKPVAA